ncbi:hypothetical protein [Mangrovibacterium diazotrophicum]|uniref:Uncharacterized protein n=1 Tax=Mangrovibacterium diazotrophicum TaxID=1261403 RepID=A0A419VY93_9BACT|nr:hypothetical protein [Mangrovibacterium diazotrophicum]RKD88176.1 hypothetical protein BC643_3319 [Mangrovibacterium diazotrophicum]
MKKLYLFILLFGCLGVTSVRGQGLSVELTGLEDSWYVSNAFVTSVPGVSSLSFVSVNLLSADYLGDEEVRLLSMSNVAWEVAKSFKPAIGLIYATGGSPRAMIGVQTAYERKKFSASFSPSYSPGQEADFKILAGFQILAELKREFSFITRLRTLSTVALDEHKFSSMRFRIGLKRNRYELGLADDFSLIGNICEAINHIGIYFQYKLL